eukprot:COSAG05_NODE_12_length_37297_cov_117.537072_24_plen_44_part_00
MVDSRFDVDHHLYLASGMDARLIALFFMCQGAFCLFSSLDIGV